MDSDIVTLKSIVVVGNTIRTSNDKASLDIPDAWQSFFEQSRHWGIPAGCPIYAVYTEYESDYRGAYTLLIGVADDTHSRPSLASCIVPAGTYARFQADGDPVSAVFQAWNHIWHQWPDRSKRNYRADFEIHGARGAGTVDIFVGIDP